MKIAIGSYGFPKMPLEETIPALAKIGFNGLEMATGPNHVGSMPEEINKERRKRLNALLKQYNMGVAAFLCLNPILAKDAQMHQENLKRASMLAELGKDLGMGDLPVISFGIGGQTANWYAQRSQIVDYLKDYADLAAKEGFILAGEPHADHAVDRVERVLWLYNVMKSPYVKLHFDIAHMALGGDTIEDAVTALLPISAHTHYMDVRPNNDGTYEILMPYGQGIVDAVRYAKAMHAGGWTSYITAEVSARIWRQEGYDPIKTAQSCYNHLDTAFKKAGVPRS